MARQEVIQVQCDRCKRMEFLPLQPKKERPELEARFGDQTLTYWDLCNRCIKALQQSWKIIKEWDKPMKQGASKSEE